MFGQNQPRPRVTLLHIQRCHGHRSPHLLVHLRRVFGRESGRRRGRGSPVIVTGGRDAVHQAARVVVALQCVAEDRKHTHSFTHGGLIRAGSGSGSVPVDQADGFVNGHTPAALFRLAVAFVASVHVLLGEITAQEIKMSRV